MAAKLCVTVLALCLFLAVQIPSGTANGAIRGAMGHYWQPCQVTHYPSLCAVVLASHNESTSGDEHVYASVAVTEAGLASNKAVSDLLGQMKTMRQGQDQVRWDTLTGCWRKYGDIVSQLNEAAASIRKNDYQELKGKITGAMAGVKSCYDISNAVSNTPIKANFDQMNDRVIKLLNIALSFAVHVTTH